MDTKDLRFFRQVYEERRTCLFERLANGMVPTESGTYLYENSTPLLEQFDEIMIGLRQIQDRDQKLKIGFSCGVLNVFPLQKLEEYQKQYSHIRLQWEEAAARR